MPLAGVLSELFGQLISRLLHHTLPLWAWLIVGILAIIILFKIRKSKPKRIDRTKE